jgi:cytidylate kinase
MEDAMIIALDGPSGAGKSTIAREVAKRLGFSCLDTGAMYRCVAWHAIQNGVALDDAEALGEAARSCEISFGHVPGNPAPSAVFVDGRDVTREIRTGEIDRTVSAVAGVPAVRSALVAQQQRIGRAGDYVVDGRDIGTVVFPEAEVKVFMTASAEERARRRVNQNKARGVGDTDFERVLADIVHRDEVDSSRDASPLRPADDAVLLDTSEMSIEEVIAFVIEKTGR